jgi:heme O synthase-like polyprenyltransferase
MTAADAQALNPAGANAGWRGRLAAYVGLTKPRIIELLLVTTVPAMVLADRGMPSPWLVLTVLVGGTLAAAGANTINCVCDRDIDEKMKAGRSRSAWSRRKRRSGSGSAWRSSPSSGCGPPPTCWPPPWPSAPPPSTSSSTRCG